MIVALLQRQIERKPRLKVIHPRPKCGHPAGHFTEPGDFVKVCTRCDKTYFAHVEPALIDERFPSLSLFKVTWRLAA